MHPESDYLDNIAADEAEQARQHAALRDQFACAALTGLLAGTDYEYRDEVVTHRAYMLADCMLAARSLKKETQP